MKDPRRIAAELGRLVSGRVAADRVTRTLYATDASMYRIVPAAVVEPRDVRDVQAAVRYARENRIPIVPRGAGTGLAGEALTDGIVLDLTVHLDGLLGIDQASRRARLLPGLAHGSLNRAARPLGLHFGPDPATSNRCTMGGMVANNSAGAHSVRYGMTRRWVRSLKVVLDDGSLADLEKTRLDDPAFAASLASGSRLGAICRDLVPLLEAHAGLIEGSWPDAPRNRLGYMLKDTLKDGVLDLPGLFCASEGTLGIVVEAELELAGLPEAVGLVAFMFRDRRAAAEATAVLLRHDPSAVELIDEYSLDMARSREVYARLFDKSAGSVLLVEFDGRDAAETEAKVAAAEKDVAGPGGPAHGLLRCPDAATRAVVWEMRKHIAGMMSRVPGALKPVPLIEDVCVRPERLPQYIDGLERVLGKRGVKFLCYGHAGDGVIHVRPYLDLRDPATQADLPALCDEVYDVALALRGSLSGEHGDGFLRAPFIRKQYGPLADVFLRVKRIFDPDDVLNPGKKADCADAACLGRRLRFLSARAPEGAESTLGEGEGGAAEAEKCTGCGACRTRLADTGMCPLHRSRSTEVASPRAKANLLLAERAGELDQEDLAELAEAARACLHCQACRLDCPAGVDASRLALELSARCARDLGVPVDAHLMGALEGAMRLGSRLPGLTNALSRSALGRYGSRLVAGLAPERVPPALAARPFIRAHPELRLDPGTEAGGGPRVVYFVDLYADLVDTSVASAFVALLRRCGVVVAVPPQKSCGVVHLNYGNLAAARKTARANVAAFLPYVREGWRVVATEPTAALMLREEYRLLLDGPEVREVGEATEEATSFLLRLAREGRLKGDFAPLALRLLHHTPCHLRALGGGTPSLELLKAVPGLVVAARNSGCCGIAGTFGLRAGNHGESRRLAEGLFRELGRRDVDAGLTECSACRMQMEHGAPDKPVHHPVQLLARSLGLA